jgi:hypothetical protein
MRTSLSCLLLVCLAVVASAQSKTSLAAGDNTVQMNSALRELYIRSATDGSTEAKAQASQNADLEYERRLFRDRAKHFVDLWTKMTQQMNEQNVVDVKLARKLSSAFHDLEKSSAWPVRDQK